MNINAIFMRKETQIGTEHCTVEKIIELSESEFCRFRLHLLQDYDFIAENCSLMRVSGGVTHAILVTGEGLDDGILVNSEGSSYARYAAFVPNVRAIIESQNRYSCMKKLEAELSDSVEKLIGHLQENDINEIILLDQDLAKTYDIDQENIPLFMKMLAERDEIYEITKTMDGSGIIISAAEIEPMQNLNDPSLEM